MTVTHFDWREWATHAHDLGELPGFPPDEFAMWASGLQRYLRTSGVQVIPGSNPAAAFLLGAQTMALYTMGGAQPALMLAAMARIFVPPDYQT